MDNPEGKVTVPESTPQHVAHLTDVIFLSEPNGVRCSSTYRPYWDQSVLKSLGEIFKAVSDVELHFLYQDPTQPRTLFCSGPLPHHVSLYSSINRVPHLGSIPKSPPVSLRWYCSPPPAGEKISLDVQEEAKRGYPLDPLQLRLVEAMSVHVPALGLQDDMVAAIEAGKRDIIRSMTNCDMPFEIVRVDDVVTRSSATSLQYFLGWCLSRVADMDNFLSEYCQ